MILPSVSSLNVSRRPNAILGAVIAIVVFAFNGVLCAGSRPHVGDEVLKAMQPALADRNSTVAVEMPLAASPFASPDHVLPDVVLGRSLGVVAGAHSVSSHALNLRFDLQAPARLSVAVVQVSRADQDFDATFTETSPAGNGIVSVALPYSFSAPQLRSKIRTVESQ